MRSDNADGLERLAVEVREHRATLNEDTEVLRYLLRLPPTDALNAVAGSAGPLLDADRREGKRGPDQDRRSRLGRPDDLHEAVARLRGAFPCTPPTMLMVELHDSLVQADNVLEFRRSSYDVRDTLAATGWLHLLAATARFDLFDRAASRVHWSAAERLAHESGDSELLSWTYETVAHFSLVEGRLQDATRFCRKALATAPPRSNAAVAGQLQEARCWSQLGSPTDALVALRRASAIFERLPGAGAAGDHYSFDAPKFQFFAATTYAEAGMTAAAETLARSVIAACDHRPNTASNARVTLAIALAHHGAIDEAAHEVTCALAGPRIHPDTLRRARELGRLLAPHAAVGSVQELHAQLTSLARREANGE